MGHRTPTMLAIGAVVAAMAVTGCGSGSGSGGGSAKTSGPIDIGVVASSTGLMAAYDGPPTQGEQLAVEDINAKGGVLGRKLQLVKYDQKSVISRGTTGALDVIGKGAVAVIVACDFDFGSPGALAAQSKQVPALSTCAGDPKFGVQGIGPYAYTMAPASNYEAAALAEWAYQKKGWRTAYVITDDTVQYTKDIAKYASERFTQLGGKIVGQDSMSSSDQSIAGQITRLAAVKPAPDVVILSSLNPDLASAVKQIRAAGINLPLIGGAGYDGTYWLKSIPNLSNVYHSALGYIDGPGIPANYNIVQKFRAQYHQSPLNAYFLTGYADIQALAAAIQKAGTTDGPKLNAALSSLTRVPTVMGPLTYTTTQHSPGTFPIIIDGYYNGQEKLLTQWTPHEVPPAF